MSSNQAYKKNAEKYPNLFISRKQAIYSNDHHFHLSFFVLFLPLAFEQDIYKLFVRFASGGHHTQVYMRLSINSRHIRWNGKKTTGNILHYIHDSMSQRIEMTWAHIGISKLISVDRLSLLLSVVVHHQMEQMDQFEICIHITWYICMDYVPSKYFWPAWISYNLDFSPVCAHILLYFCFIVYSIYYKYVLFISCKKISHFTHTHQRCGHSAVHNNMQRGIYIWFSAVKGERNQLNQKDV